MLNVVNPALNLRAFRELAGVLFRYRALILEMTRRDVVEQYAGQVLGAFWAIGHPLFLMALYVFIFGYVFNMKIGGTYDLPLDYTVYILSGLIPWMAIQQSMSKACAALTGQANLVKQVVFPIEVLPTKAVLSSFIPQIAGTVFLLGYVILKSGALPLTYLLLPVLIGMQLLVMLGIAFALSVISAYLRDAKDLVQVFGTAGIYLMPVVYLPAWVPSIFKPVLYLNPFSYVTWCYQDALYFGRIEHPWAWLVFGVGSVITFAMGYRLFRRLKPHLGNVL
jgi:lipopolysaccharide transport system permease protein